MMGMINRIFTRQPTPSTPLPEPTTFTECLNIVSVWTMKAAIDPDLTFEDTALRSAMKARVTCPYCSSEIVFGQAMKSSGASISIVCPHCRARSN
jgi:transposase-like protein